MLNIRGKYDMWLTFFWAGTPPAPEFTTKPTLRGTPRQLMVEYNDWRRDNSSAYMGIMIKDAQGNEYGFDALQNAIWEAGWR